MSEQTETSARVRRILIAIVPVSLAGLGFSIELTRIYYRSMQDVGFSALCSINERVDCISVALSSYSMILGIPNSAFGAAFYAALILLAALQLRSRRPVFRHLKNYIFIGSLIALAYSIYLAYISSFVLRTFCLYCTVLYVLNFAIFIMSLFTLDSAGTFFRQFKNDGEELKKDPVMFGVLVSLALVFIFSGVLWAWHVEQKMKKRLITDVENIELNINLKGDPQIGETTAPVTIVEFTDYECYACKRMHFVLKKLELKYRPRVRIIFKTFPIYKDCNPFLGVSYHPHACEAAYATECAYRFGRFDDYVDTLFTAAAIDWSILIEMAESLGMDKDEFENCMKSEDVLEEVMKDAYDAHLLKLRGTPIIFVNSKKYDGYKTLEEMSLIVDSFLYGIDAGDKASAP